MLAGMIEGWVLWLFLVGLGVGILTTWLLVARLPRREVDVSDAERRAEAAWIGSIIERHGGIAPESLVEEVLDLHGAYLQRMRPQDDGPTTLADPYQDARPASSQPPPPGPYRPAPPPGSGDPGSQRPG